MRPRLIVVVTGTGTEVGKTWVSVETLRRLGHEGVRVAVRKPVQSYEPVDEVTDALLLGRATAESAYAVCPEHRWYPTAMAPPMAAAKLGMPSPLLPELIDEVTASWPEPPADVGLVEGAGGVASPLALDGDTSDLAKRLHADLVVLVADPGLGTINAVRLACRALEPLPVIVYLNRFDDGQELHASNRAWLGKTDGLDLCSDGEDLARRIVQRLRV
jgi:dethiobiotin synthetase